jgi:uncharacterized protein
MSTNLNAIEAVLLAADGEIVGKIRTQKIFYLLEQLGMNNQYSYAYHHFGPYSHDLAQAIDANVAFKIIDEKPVSGQFGNTYSVFSFKESPGPVETVGDLKFDFAREKIEMMKGVSSVVLELAATIHWLIYKEKIANWSEEIVIRKPQKATEERVRKAETLLTNLGLA